MYKPSVASVVLILILFVWETSAQISQCEGPNCLRNIGGMRLGGSKNLSPEELQSPEHLERAIKILRAKEGYSASSGQPKIIKGSSQVVAGFKYEYTVVYKEDDEHRVCKLASFERDWLMEKQPDQAFIYSSTCI